MSQVSALLARFRIGYPGCSTIYALQLLNDATKSQAIQTEMRQIIYTINLVQNQREYIIDPSIILIKEAYWVRTSTPGDQQVLYQTSDDWLAENRQGWRGFSWNGQSWNIYVSTTSADNSTIPGTASPTAPGTSMVIGFDPPPNLTTQAGYPCVQLYCTTWLPFTIDDYLPDNLGTDQMWIDRLNMLYTNTTDLTQVGARKQLEEISQQETIARVKNTELQVQTTIRPGFVQFRRRI